MKPSIAKHCAKCKQYHCIEIENGQELKCPGCGFIWGAVIQISEIFDHCPVCTCRQFYLTKDFNQFLGCLVVLLGIVFVPLTYGLSLPVFALIDWLLYKRTKALTVCYRCGSEFRHIPTNKAFKPFMHHIGLKYDKYR